MEKIKQSIRLSENSNLFLPSTEKESMLYMRIFVDEKEYRPFPASEEVKKLLCYLEQGIIFRRGAKISIQTENADVNKPRDFKQFDFVTNRYFAIHGFTKNELIVTLPLSIETLAKIGAISSLTKKP